MENNQGPLAAFQPSDSQGLTMADFHPDINEVAPVSNKASNVNLAAHAAMFSPDPSQAVDNYNAVSGQMDLEGQSSVADNLIGSAQAAEKEKVKSVLPTLLADKTISDQAKSNAIADAFNDDSPMYNPANILTAQSLSREVPQESVEAESTRFDSGNVINAVNEARRAQQTALNLELAKADPSMAGKVSDFISMLIPFTNQLMTAKALTEVTGNPIRSYAKSFLAEGSARSDLRDALANAPVDQQVEMTKKLVDIINNSQSIVMSTPNDFRRTQLLQETLGQDGPSDAGVWADNLMSVADLAFGAGAILKGAKGIKGALKIADSVGGAAEDATGTLRGLADAAHEPKPADYYTPMKSEIEKNLKTELSTWMVSKPDPSDFEQGVQASIDGTKTPRRTSTEVDYATALSKWKGAKPTADSVEADLKRQVSNFNRRKGPAASNTEKNLADDIANSGQKAPASGLESSLADEIAAFQAKKAAEDVPNIAVSRVQPLSVSQVLKDTNIDQARALHSATAGDESGRTAEAAYGTTREDAIVSDLAPQVGTNSGAVDAKVAVPDANDIKALQVDPELEAFSKNDGAIYYTDAQKLANQSRIVNDFQQAVGVTSRKEMFSIRSGTTAEGKASGRGGVTIKGIYGPQESGFSDPQSALDAVAFSLRDYGVDENSLQLMKRVGSDYIPVSKEAALEAGTGDYLVQANHEYKYNPFTMQDWPNNKVKSNWGMQSGVLQGKSGAGSLQRHLFNITSMLEPHITLSMSKGITKMAGVQRQFLRLATDVAKSFSGLSKAEKSTVMSMIKQGNIEGKWFSKTEQMARGLSDKAQETLTNWKKYWDNHFHFENIDHTRSLSNQGYQKYVNGADDTNMWAKPINSEGRVPDRIPVFDSEQNAVRVMTPDELSDLYKNGGKIAELENTELHGGKEFKHIISKETADGGYLRAFNDFDQTLNYREGYFHVAYKDPHFIIKTLVNDNGKAVGERAVATAANAKDAEIMRTRLEAMDGGEYKVRGVATSDTDRTRDYRSVQRAKGRSAQRFRGQRLESATSIISDPSYSHIQDPMEAMVSSAHSISRRISMRDPIEAMKKGLMEQYGHLMPKVDGQARFPNNIMDITNPTGNTRVNKDVAAARSTYEYIQQMEVGYMNHIDEGYKAALNKIADLLGEVSVDRKGLVSSVAQAGEGAARAANSIKPSSVLRSSANTFFIVTNPIRQLLVQGHQVMQLVPIVPKFFSNPRNLSQVMFLISKSMGHATDEKMLKFMGVSSEEAEDIWTHFKMSGNYAAVDSHTMINGSIKNFVDGLTPAQNLASRASQIALKPVSLLRKVGFDAGENLNQMVAWLAFRHKAIEEGGSMADAAVRDKVAATATQFTGNMNKAGQNAYEGNALNIGLQFMGWAHRWAGVMTGSRTFTKAEKAKLWGWQLLMYGMPGGYAGYGVFEKYLPSDPKTKDQIVQGLIGASYNKIASVTSGEDVHADWASSLTPLDMYGTASHLKEVMTGDIGAVFTDSPAGTLFFGGNPALTNMAKDAAKWTNLTEDSKDHPTKLSNVAHDFLNLFGGLSAAYKARYAMETGKKLSSWTGKVVDSNITNTQALLMLAGVQDVDQAKTRYINDTMNDDFKNLQSDVQKFHDERKRVLLNDDLTPDQFKYYLDMTSEFFRAYPHNDTAQQMYKKLVNKDIEGGDTRILSQLMHMHDLGKSKEEALALANLYPDTDDVKRQQYIHDIEFLYHGDDGKQEK